MALPKLNSSPSYSMTIPSTGQQVTFRPFLVKEQKNLLIAVETQEQNDVVRAVIRTVEACVEQPLKGPLTTCDIDYAFTMIRAKSVGESAEIVLQCRECEQGNDVVVQLDKVQVVGDPKPRTIKITDEVSIKMRHSSYEEVLSNPNLTVEQTATETLMHTVLASIDSIMTNEERYDAKDVTQEELVEFLEAMTPDQFNLIAQFIADSPMLQQTVEFDCVACGHHNDYTLQGMKDFF